MTFGTAATQYLNRTNLEHFGLLCPVLLLPNPNIYIYIIKLLVSAVFTPVKLVPTVSKFNKLIREVFSFENPS